MPMDAHDIESMIKAAIPDAEVTIRDLAGDGDHYAATVISESFRGKSRVQQHQIVYQSLRGQMGGVLHALALQTGVPEGQSARRAVSSLRAQPAQPRHLCRAVFRSGVRFRGHADIAHPARPVHPARRGADDAAVPGCLVGVGLHLLDYQLARSRDDAGPGAAVSADARRAGALDLDSKGL